MRSYVFVVTLSWISTLWAAQEVPRPPSCAMISAGLSVGRSYRFELEQAVEARAIVDGSVQGLVDLVDRAPERPYARLSGSLLLASVCERVNEGEEDPVIVFKAQLRGVNATCLGDNPIQREECRSRFSTVHGAVAAAPFFFEWSLVRGVEDVRTLLGEHEQAASLKKALVSALTRPQRGNCSAVVAMEMENGGRGGATMRTIDHDSGFHGAGGSEAEHHSFHSLRVHQLSVGPRQMVAGATARGAFALDGKFWGRPGFYDRSS